MRGVGGSEPNGDDAVVPAAAPSRETPDSGFPTPSGKVLGYSRPSPSSPQPPRRPVPGGACTWGGDQSLETENRLDTSAAGPMAEATPSVGLLAPVAAIELWARRASSERGGAALEVIALPASQPPP